MSCVHKFQKYLNLDGVDFKPQVLIVGTFNPAWPATNDAGWFYGRTKNNCFWDVLPRLYNEKSLRDAEPKDWKLFCERHAVAITDLISSIEDADENNAEHLEWLGGYSDKNIEQRFRVHQFTDVVGLIEKYDSISRVFLTRRNDQGLWKKAWKPIRDICEIKGVWQSTLLTPSRYACLHKPKEFRKVEDYILSRWHESWR